MRQSISRQITLRLVPDSSTGKNSPAVWETWVQSLVWEDPLEKGMETHSSIFAWQATVHGVTKSLT